MSNAEARTPADHDAAPLLVVGAGLSGLVAAEHLHRAGRRVVVLEARDRIGGRCWSPSVGPSGARCDLGAAWHWEMDRRVMRLADRLGLPRIRQAEPSNQGPPYALLEHSRQAPVQRVPWSVLPPPSWRIQGGAQQLHAALAARLPDDAIRRQHSLRACTRHENGIRCVTATPDGEHVVSASAVLLAVPPRLLVQTVDFTPPLPDSMRNAMNGALTWMSHSAKAAVTYSRPFWRENDLAGRVQSRVGPVHDWHDASSDDGAALVGFMHPPGPDSPTPKASGARRDALVDQLVRCFGPDASEPIGLTTHSWRDDPHTNAPDGSICSPTAHPDNIPQLRDALWDGRLHLASAETARDRPGYLDGAVEAGRRAATAVLRNVPAS